MPMNVYVVSAHDNLRFPRHDPVSPELALVDPELARRERGRLPHPWEEEARARIAALSLEQVAPGRDVPRTAALRARVRRRRPWVRRVAVAMVLVTIFVLAVVTALARTGAGDRTLSQDPVTPAGVSLARAPLPSTADVQASAPPAVKPKSPSAPAPRKPVRPSKPAPTNPQSAERSFAWAPAAGASGYHVEFFRGDARIFVGDTRRPAVTLPASWQFGGRRRQLGPGEYRWYVWPVVRGNRRSEAIVQAELTVPSP